MSRPAKLPAVPRKNANATADRVIDLLLLFDDRQPAWTVPDLMKKLGLPRSTIYRYLATLRNAQLLTESGDGAYQLGPRIQLLANVARASTSAIDLAREEMLKIAESFNETVLFNERVDYDIVTLERIESRHRLRLTAHRGSLLPWPATVSAKLLLAYAPPHEQEQFWAVSHPMAYTPHTLATRAALEHELTRIRQQGYATANEERDEGIIGVAVPIAPTPYTHRCLSIVAPKFRIPPDVFERMRHALLISAQTLRRHHH